MAKPLKIALWIAGILVLIVVAAAIALPLLFDPNDYRDRIAGAVKDATGRDCSLGTIELKVFPWLHVSVADVTLANAQGFGSEPFAHVGEAGVGVRLMPLLFHHKIMVSTVTLSGLQLNLAKDQGGRDNWSDIGARDHAAEVRVDDDKAAFDPASIDIGGIEVKDSALAYVDAQSGKSYRLSDLSLSTGAIRSGKAVDLQLGAHVVSAAPAADLLVDLKGSALPDLAAHHLTVDDLALGVKGRALDYDTDSRLTAKVDGDLAAKLFKVGDIELQSQLKGAALPGGAQTLAFTGDLVLDQAKGTLQLTQAQVKAAGLTVDTTISGENLNGDAPRLSGPITVAAFNPRQWLTALGVKLTTADTEALKQASLSARYSGSFSAATLDHIALELDQTHVTGSLAVKDFATQALEFALKVDALDADRYLPPKPRKGGDDGKGGDKTPPDLSQVKLPTETLARLNANGVVEIGTLTVNGIKMSDVRLKLSGDGNAPREQQVSAHLYGGTFSTANRISPGKEPSFALKTQLSALNAAPFLKDFLGKDYVSGLGNLDLDVSGHGDTLADALKVLDGTVGFRFENGAIKGFNLGQLLRRAQATLAGNLNYAEDAPQETDFTAITGTATIVDGVLKNDKLEGASPAFRLLGSGQVDLTRLTIDYLAKPTVVETKTGQGGKALDELKGLTIPIRVTGTLLDPKYKVDLQEALQQKAASRLHQEYEKQEDRAKEKLREGLNNLLFGKPKKPAPAPAPQNPPPATAPQTSP